MNTCRARYSASAAALLLAAAASGTPVATPNVVAAETTPAATVPKPVPIAPEAGSYDVGLMLGSQLEHNGVVPILSLDGAHRPGHGTLYGEPYRRQGF